MYINIQYTYNIYSYCSLLINISDELEHLRRARSSTLPFTLTLWCLELHQKVLSEIGELVYCTRLILLDLWRIDMNIYIYSGFMVDIWTWTGRISVGFQIHLQREREIWMDLTKELGRPSCFCRVRSISSIVSCYQSAFLSTWELSTHIWQWSTYVVNTLANKSS